MPKGVIWLIAGTAIGLVAGAIVANFVVGAAAGFVIALVLLLAGNWLGGRGDGEGISISGR